MAVVLLVVVPSCGGKDSPVAVEGIVTLDGAPVEGASVTFTPEGEGGQPAYGLTDTEGAFWLTTFSEQTGALPGAYKVLVTKTEPVTLSELKDGADPRRVRFQAMEQRKKKPPKALIPEVYGNPKRTPLRWQVPDNGKMTLELNSKVS
jgi:hypothetical protein